MKLFALLFLSTIAISHSHAETGGILIIPTDNRNASLIENEALEDGKLSQFFDHLKLQEIIIAQNRKAKVFTLSNKRFAFQCTKVTFDPNPPATTCTFIIQSGPSTADTSTQIENQNSFAMITLNSSIAQEFESVFETAPDHSIDLTIRASNGATFNISGNTRNSLMIHFIGK